MRCDQELFNARQKLKYGGYFGRRYRRDQLIDWMAYSIQTLLRSQGYIFLAASAIEARRGETERLDAKHESAASEAGDAQ
jgi:hypothetical protein